MWRAVLRTKNFHFEAYGISQDAAREAMVKGLRQHAREKHLENWPPPKHLGDIQFDDVHVGWCYRDNRLLTR